MESENGKLFVGGISQETSEETLRDHFGEYGEIKACEILRDRATGKGRGFGFVTFTDPSVVDKVLKRVHKILGRTVEVKLPTPKGEKYQNQYPSQPTNGSCRNCCNGNCNGPLNPKKIFVGGLPSSLTKEEFKGYFEGFGSITDSVVMYDKENDKPRGFGFITFDSEEAVESVLQQRFHRLNDKTVEVKRAQPKDIKKGLILTYNCNDLGHNLERLSVSSSSGLYQDYVTSCNISPPSILPYGSFPAYYYGAPYGPSCLTETYNGVGVGPSSFQWNQMSHGNHVIYEPYNNGGACFDSRTGGVGDVSNSNGGFPESAMPIANNGRTSGLVGVSNGNGGYDESAMRIANKNCNKIDGDGDGDGDGEEPALPQTDDALSAESSDTEHQKQEDCQSSSPCKSS